MRILVIDDELNLLRAVESGLEAEGFAVDTATNGVDGLWLARENSYAAIVLDIMLPGQSGFRVCEELRQAGDWTPVIMLTAKDGDLDQVEALDTGADDYLTKPFSFQVLLARLRALIRRGATERPVVLTAGDLSVDPASKRVERAGTPIELTTREFSVLEFLVSRAGQVVSKAEVLGAVWDFDFDGDPNIVEVYVRHLRNKIDRPFGRSTIETLRGSGYRLRADG
ncbi:response regulator transcription factor [Herbiconiux sp. KACC 21604]|uniref:response regulator transcription factor n=1 Tax=unclassified Herbiconiux TaxID=2618217 RepID=UPI001490EC5B|nr:response regulator transcription factor [Herbiconiux sp. SALV-R1]QJU54722.1 response regulator transcription factor [Herbiconiux sp. SALV-R1]WPO85826.1 response regulator transcription factor [Herbiconiux sp. KACC 21604]